MYLTTKLLTTSAMVVTLLLLVPAARIIEWQGDRKFLFIWNVMLGFRSQTRQF